ncbi:hypothetical protein, partial [Xanthomonas perforans]|uniref:hypothetical protein n=1 Tax=Xanthomonas perforans TaxID=442694 RepID=UPI001F19A27A
PREAGDDEDKEYVAAAQHHQSPESVCRESVTVMLLVSGGRNLARYATAPLPPTSARRWGNRFERV